MMLAPRLAALLLLAGLGAACGRHDAPDLNRPETVEDVIGPVQIPEDHELVALEEPPDEAPALAASAAPPAGEDAEAITFTGDEADPAPTERIEAPPKRPTLPALELFGSGGRGGPGQR